MPVDESTRKQYNTPSPKNAPIPKPTPGHRKKIKNFADKEETCAKFLSSTKFHYERFRDQSERTKNNDRITDADLMYRVSKRKPTGKDDMDTVSNVSDPGFYIRMRTVTANEMSIFFDSEDLPAKFTPVIGSDEISDNHARSVAERQNMLERYTFNIDNRREKIHRTLMRTNKYGNLLCSMQWDRQVKVTDERVPSRDGKGKIILNKKKMPKKFTNKRMERVVKDNPTYLWHDIKDSFFDATIEDMQEQMCILTRRQVTLNDIHRKQRQDEYMNVDKINTKHLFLGESDSDILSRRKTNAEEGDSTEEANGLYDEWNEWLLAPINDDGKWDDSILATWHWGTFIGNIDGSDRICVRLSPNPFPDGENPYLFLHSHDDDKGAFHMGHVDIMVDLYYRETTNQNQAFDNVDLRSRAPAVIDGQVFTEDLTFTRNKIIEVAPGTTIDYQTVPDTTQITMQMSDRIDSLQDQVSNTDAPIRGEALGGRATRGEAQNVFDQASKRVLDKADYFADQLFLWMLRKDAVYWRHFGDPAREIMVTNTPEPVMIKPAELWGPIEVQVTAVKDFESTTVQRQQNINFFNGGGFDKAVPHMGKSGAEGPKVFLRNFFKDQMKFKDVDLMFPRGKNKDAVDIAMRESASMLMDSEFIEPQEGQAHDIHLRVHEEMEHKYNNLPENELSKANLTLIQQHIEATEQLKEREEQEDQAQSQQAQQPGGPEGMPVEQQEAAVEGAVANV